MTTTVLIVDDHAPFRHLARELLEDEGFTVVGEAVNGARAISDIETLKPQIVLLDLQLPDISGLEVARRVHSVDAERPAVVLTSARDGEDFGSLIRDSGARGFIGKSELSGAALRRLVG